MAKPFMSVVDVSEFVRGRLVAMGVSEDVAQRVSAGSDIASEESDELNIEPRDSIVLGYPVSKQGFTRMKEVAVTNMPAGGLVEMLDDQVKMATFLDQGMRATPATLRLELPAWVHEKSRAAQNAQAMGRSRKLAEAEQDRISGGEDPDPVLDIMGITEDHSSNTPWR